MSVDRALHIVEIVHWIALGVMGVVYTIRLLWLLSFKNAQDRQKPGDMGDTSLRPRIYSLMNVMMPWGMESTRTNFPFYLSFLVFHAGVVAGIGLAFISSLAPSVVRIPMVSYAVMGILGAAGLIGLARVVRRFTNPVIKLISTPDDKFCVILLTGWFFSGATAQAHIAGFVASKWAMVVFLAATSFFLIYVPFSKISHYLYYPFTRYWIGKTLGHRGSMPPMKG
jgi:nitrate reductase gamma subunit